ncbi:MAG: hypothetical protein ABI642_08545 [Polaromonas sp.]
MRTVSKDILHQRAGEGDGENEFSVIPFLNPSDMSLLCFALPCRAAALSAASRLIIEMF